MHRKHRGPHAGCIPTVSDQVRLLALQVMKTTKQTSTEAVTYPQALKVCDSASGILLLAFDLAGTVLNVAECPPICCCQSSQSESAVCRSLVTSSEHV